jgi:hypothetical protein
MKPLRWWVPVASALLACSFGFATYAALNWMGKMPEGLRNHPWPMESAAVATTLVTIGIAVRAYRQSRVRVAATLSAALAALATSGFVFYVNVLSYRLPPPPKDLAVGTVAPDFTLSDEANRAVTLSRLRGQPTLLVFYRGFW